MTLPFSVTRLHSAVNFCKVDTFWSPSHPDSITARLDRTIWKGKVVSICYLRRCISPAFVTSDAPALIRTTNLPTDRWRWRQKPQWFVWCYFHLLRSAAPVSGLSRQPLIIPSMCESLCSCQPNWFCHSQLTGKAGVYCFFPFIFFVRGKKQSPFPLSSTAPLPLSLLRRLQNAIHFTGMCISCTGVELLFRPKMSFYSLVVVSYLMFLY